MNIHSAQNFHERPAPGWQQRLHIDSPLLLGLIVLCSLGLLVLYSASSQDMGHTLRQLTRLGIAFTVLFVVAQVPPSLLQRWTPWLYASGLIMLAIVPLMGDIGKGAQRWLDLGFIRFQPSEIMKLTVPMMVACYLAEAHLPPAPKRLIIAGLIIIVPVVLIAMQPDLGTSLLIGSAGFFVLFLAGMSWRILGSMFFLAAAGAPVLWHFMHDYQRQRVITFLNPEQDPLGSGYHIIQSKIAIGSGGIYGKGWLNGTQAQLDFLPERSTDFIFAVLGEEAGLMGILVLLFIYGFIIVRSLFISTQAQDTFTRLLGGSLALTFLIYIIVNTGMVTGLLPVVGLPLPLISYGGTSMVTLMAGFGILMSIHTHRKLLPA
ncbi:MAG: rod shape-determining protein RodA [Gammaproteobacteria bacterium]|nr:rod shape-determining protein RodA [Gammaproteobacteria bacterium]